MKDITEGEQLCSFAILFSMFKAENHIEQIAESQQNSSQEVSLNQASTPLQRSISRVPVAIQIEVAVCCDRMGYVCSWIVSCDTIFFRLKTGLFFSRLPLCNDICWRQKHRLIDRNKLVKLGNKTRQTRDHQVPAVHGLKSQILLTEYLLGKQDPSYLLKFSWSRTAKVRQLCYKSTDE